MYSMQCKVIMFEFVFASSVNKPDPFETDMDLGGLVQHPLPPPPPFFFSGGNAGMQFIVEGKNLTVEVLSAL